MVVLCANVFCQARANAPPYQETNDGITVPNGDCRREPAWPGHRYNPYRSNGEAHKETTQQADKPVHGQNSDNAPHPCPTV